jgi:hypothetical protein
MWWDFAHRSLGSTGSSAKRTSNANAEDLLRLGFIVTDDHLARLRQKIWVHGYAADLWRLLD